MSEYRLRVTPEEVVKAMQGEAEAGLFYERLMRMAPTREEADIIKQIRADEVKHYEAFEELYRRMTGRNPRVPEPAMPNFRTYMEGVELAFIDELEAYDYYRDLYLSTQNPRIRDIFLDAFTDENEHAQYLHWIYSMHHRMYKNNSNMQNMMPMGAMQPWQTGNAQIQAPQMGTGMGGMWPMPEGQMPMGQMGMGQMPAGQMSQNQMGMGQMAGNMMSYGQQAQDEVPDLLPDMGTLMQPLTGMNSLLQQIMPENPSTMPYQQNMDEMPPNPLKSFFGREEEEKKVGN